MHIIRSQNNNDICLLWYNVHAGFFWGVYLPCTFFLSFLTSKFHLIYTLEGLNNFTLSWEGSLRTSLDTLKALGQLCWFNLWRGSRRALRVNPVPRLRQETAELSVDHPVWRRTNRQTRTVQVKSIFYRNLGTSVIQLYPSDVPLDSRLEGNGRWPRARTCQDFLPFIADPSLISV